MGNSSSNGQKVPAPQGMQEALAVAIREELLREEQSNVAQQELLARVSRLEEELAVARRQQAEDQKRKNGNQSPVQAMQNGSVGSGLPPAQTVTPVAQSTQAYHGQPLLQGAPVGQHAGQCGQPMMGTGVTGNGQHSGQFGGSTMPTQLGGRVVGQSVAGMQPGGQSVTMMGQMSQSMMSAHQEEQNHPRAVPQPGGHQTGQSMTGGQPMMGGHQGVMSHSTMRPQQFGFPPPGPNSPGHPMHMYAPPFPDINEFQPPIGRMGPRMPQNRGGFPHPYRRDPEHYNHQNTNPQNNQDGSPSKNPCNRRPNQTTKDRPRARSTSRDEDGLQKRSNNSYRQNKKDVSNQKPAANPGAIPKRNPFGQMPKQQLKSGSASDDSQPNKTTNKPKKQEQQKSALTSEAPPEKGVPRTVKEQTPLFSSKYSTPLQKVAESVKSSDQKPREKSPFFDRLKDGDLAKLNSENPELWDVKALAKLFVEDDEVTEPQPAKPSLSGNTKPVEISDLAKMFERDEATKPVHELNVAKPRYNFGSQNQQKTTRDQQKKDAAAKYFDTDVLRNMLDNLNLLTASDSKIDLEKMIEKIELSQKPGQATATPKTCPGVGKGAVNNLNKDAGPSKFNADHLQCLMKKLNLPSSSGSSSTGSELPSQKITKQPCRRGGIQKKQAQHKKQIAEASDDSNDSSDDSSDTISSMENASESKFKNRKPFLKHLTPGELPPLSKMNAGKNGYLKLFIGKKIPTQREARAMGVKTAQMYRKVEGVLMRSGRTFVFPTTIMDIIEFGEKHPNAVANFTSDLDVKSG